MEENVKSGGFGESVIAALQVLGWHGTAKIIALPNQFLPHATRQELLAEHLISPLQNVL
jgi:deoxyxylulose-5-phosphate synthase